MNTGKLWLAIAVVAAGLAAAPAEAHERYRYPVVTGHYYVSMPSWLHRHPDFRRWYRLHHHRYGPRVDWRDLYRHYERDRRYHRHGRKDACPYHSRRRHRHH